MNGNSDNSFAKKSAEFLKWFAAQPGASFYPALTIGDLRSRNAGRGIIATADIPADTALFTIPRHIIVTTENSSLRRACPSILSGVEDANGNGSDEQAPLDPWLALIATLIYEHLQGGTSPWKPYLDVLPASFETPMFWSDAELDELQASAVRGMVGKAGADEMFRGVLVPLVRRHEGRFFPAGSRRLGNEEIVALAHRMGSTIMAYAFDLENEDEGEGEGEDGWVEDREGQMLGMVPMADMLNADAEFNAHLNHGEASLTMTSLRPIKAGEEVLNYYGPLPNSDLLRRYGYTTPAHSLHDVVEIPWALVLRVAQHVLRLDDDVLKAAAEQLDADELEDSFVLERDTIEPDSTGVLPARKRPITAISAELVRQVKRLVKAAAKLAPSAVPSAEAAALDIISASLSTRLAEYATSIAQDEAMLQQETGVCRRMAVEVRIGEKRILQETKEFVDGLVHNTAERQPSAKRQRTS